MESPTPKLLGFTSHLLCNYLVVLCKDNRHVLLEVDEYRQQLRDLGLKFIPLTELSVYSNLSSPGSVKAPPFID